MSDNDNATGQLAQLVTPGAQQQGILESTPEIGIMALGILAQTKGMEVIAGIPHNFRAHLSRQMWREEQLQEALCSQPHPLSTQQLWQQHHSQWQ
jgi:hypothetical protein